MQKLTCFVGHSLFNILAVFETVSEFIDPLLCLSWLFCPLCTLFPAC